MSAVRRPESRPNPRNPRESGDPALRRKPWIPAFAGMTVVVVLCLFFAFATPVVHAQVGTDVAPIEFRDAAEEARFHALVAELRCVMCQNQSLADSNAQIAFDLRREVLTLMREGRSDAEIKDFLVARYGEFVLYRPRLEATTWLLWLGPAVLLVVGGVVVWRATGRGAVPDDNTQER